MKQRVKIIQLFQTRDVCLSINIESIINIEDSLLNHAICNLIMVSRVKYIAKMCHAIRAILMALD